MKVAGEKRGGRMEARKGKIEYKFLCMLTAAGILMLLAVLPHADTVSPSASAGASRCLGSGASRSAAAESAAGRSPASGTEPSAGQDSGPAAAVSLPTYAASCVKAPAGSGVGVTMKFTDAGGRNTDTGVKGNYYLYVTCPHNGGQYRNTVPLAVSSGTAAGTLSCLYDQNGGGPYPLFDSSGGETYTVVLFQYTGSGPVKFDGGFYWDENKCKEKNGYIKYGPGSDIADNYTVTGLPGTVTVQNGSGKIAITAAAKAGTELSRDEIWKSLSPVLPYAVFADYFKLTTHMEGCIAVNTANIGDDFGNSDNNYSHYCVSSNTITVEKTYTGSTAKTFRFRLYNKSGPPVSDIQNITLSAGKRVTGTVTFSVGGKNVEDYTVNELDGKGGIVVKDDLYDGFTLTGKTPGIKQVNGSTMNSTSYINNFEAINSSHQLNRTTPPNRLVVGSNCQVSGSDVSYSGGTIHCADPQNIEQIPRGRDFPIDFAKVLNDMAGLSKQLAQALPSDTVAVKNYKASQLKDADFDLTVGGKMLLLNIDATGCDSFEFPEEPKLKVNGDSSGSWAAAAGNIVVNVYTKDAGGYSAYRGKIKAIGYVMGIFLAPCATITDTVAVYNGTIVADRVENAPSEIHGAAAGSRSENITWSFENVEYAPAIVLPETGGTGTSVFYGTGGGILLLAAALAILRRIRGNQWENDSS